MGGGILSIYTDQGVVGEYPGAGGNALADIETVTPYLIGKDAMRREVHYNAMKRGLRHTAALGLGIVDICLWDIAGKIYEEPLFQLLGGERKPLPAYASTLHGDENGGLTTPQDFADFAVLCKEMGYPAFKIHGWGLAGKNIKREVDNVLAVRDAVGPEMDLMIDPANEVKNFGDALKLGKACDEAEFFWWEDVFMDGGVSTFAHRKLRQMIKTPLLQTEHIRLPEQHMNFVIADGTDYVRVGAHEDGGITGAMKIFHACESVGLDVETHGPDPAHRHIMSAVRNTNYYELGLVHPKIRTNKPPIWVNYSDNLDSVDENGCVYAPTGHGIGVPLDWDWINAHKTGTRVLAEL
jgi:L-alanine-DL-glutamate epimerase-like enolase superfamily enzyme